MRSTRTALATTLSAVVAALALTVGSAGGAAASEQPPAPVATGVQGEVPWTGPIPGVIGVIGEVVEVVGGLVPEVPWT
ncbi:hypothetical protein OHA37_40460 (plasmid) [Streptomyces sp. NBC_00335]|uniref:hypothetical protein n=1 Tax=unclassified Streptomyces TaxID=2593676 RepID=UPI002257FF5C|nr:MULTISPECIES: hypothetical protein [unclassified Streptomyces]MCX5410103.1 hypothetical protein [Streptomyces sp. NBC_00086]